MRTTAARSISDWPCQPGTTARPCVPARRACSGRRLEEPDSSFGRLVVAELGLGQDTGPRQVWSHRGPGSIPIARVKNRIRSGPVPMSSHLGLDPARRCRLHCASVGALSSRCDAAALGAGRAGRLRARRYYNSLCIPRAATAPLLWSTSGPIRSPPAFAPAGPG